jgi:hypothetical protein
MAKASEDENRTPFFAWQRTDVKEAVAGKNCGMAGRAGLS